VSRLPEAMDDDSVPQLPQVVGAFRLVSERLKASPVVPTLESKRPHGCGISKSGFRMGFRLSHDIVYGSGVQARQATAYT